MQKKLTIVALISWGIALCVWQLIFQTHSILSELLWEIHTIFSSVLVFYVITNLIVPEKTLDVIKIFFRILFKVWFVIFLAFSIKKSFDLRGFLLTATFAFGYLEGLIDLNNWFANQKSNFVFDFFKTKNTHKNRIPICIFSIAVIHIFSAFIAFVFFNIN